MAATLAGSTAEYRLVESLGCTSETNVTLCVNYISIKNNNNRSFGIKHLKL